MKGISSPPSKPADYIHINDEKAQGTEGGDTAGTTWETRDLNQEKSDVGGHASLASNQITLAAGTYECKISVPSANSGGHQARLYNITDTAVTLLGTSERTADPQVTTHSIIAGRFTIAASKVLEVQHYTTSARAGSGQGRAVNATTEIYTVVELKKVA